MENSRYLESHRFAPTRKGVEHIRAIGTSFYELQGMDFRIKWITFFGSFVMGNEYRNSNHSDLDIAIGDDGSEFNNLSTQTTKVIKEKAKEQKRLFKGITIPLIRQMKQRGLSVEPDKTILFVDTSQNATDESIKEFINDMNLTTRLGQRKLNIHALNNTANPLPLLTRFFLTVGENNNIYEDRAYILQQLEKQQTETQVLKNGGIDYVRYLMQYLSEWERGKTEKREALSSYKFYPQNIQEANTYFLRIYGMRRNREEDK